MEEDFQEDKGSFTAKKGVRQRLHTKAYKAIVYKAYAVPSLLLMITYRL